MKEVIEKFLTDIKYKTNKYDEEQETRVNTWLNIYEGLDNDHIYYIYNGKSKTKQQLKSLKMANQGCEDYSDYYFNEKLEITIDNEEVQAKINECLEQNNFLENANNLMQLVGALGTGAFVPYLDHDVLRINYLNATNIVILKATKTDVIDFLGVSETKVNDGMEYSINAHIQEEDGTYTIINKKYIKTNKGGIREEELPEELQKPIKSNIPKFAVIKTPRVNNLDINSPYGISLYANAIDNLIAIDKAYDTLDNEIWLGRKRVYIKGVAGKFNIDENGNATPIFDASDTAYYVLPGEEEKGEMLKESSFDLRIEELTTALQNQLNIYCDKIGLEHNHYKVKDGEVYVNTTNLVSSNSSTYRKIKKQENILTRAITELIYGIADLIGITEKFSVSVFYDDSIIEDTESTRKQAQTEYNSKLISKAQYYRDVYKLKDSEAIEFAKQMNKEIMNETISDGTEFDITE